MKSVDASTVGGRIRTSRQKLNISLKQMAEKIDVSPNYVSIIERNVKMPSDELLSKIAALTNVPFSWLKDGNGQYLGSLAEDPSLQFPSGIGNASISLFLNIVIHESPTISKEMIATMLGIEDEAVDGILNGNVKFDPAWEPGLLNLAQRLEISNILESLYGIESFLVRVENQKIDFKIITALRNFLSEEFSDSFSFVGQTQYNPGRFKDILKSNRNTDIPVREFSFLQEATHNKWKIQMYAKMNRSCLEQLLNSKQHHQLFYSSKDDYSYALVFSDEDVFNELYDINANMQLFFEAPKPIALMLMDLDSIRIKKMIQY